MNKQLNTKNFIYIFNYLTYIKSEDLKSFFNSFFYSSFSLLNVQNDIFNLPSLFFYYCYIFLIITIIKLISRELAKRKKIYMFINVAKRERFIHLKVINF